MTRDVRQRDDGACTLRKFRGGVRVRLREGRPECLRDDTEDDEAQRHSTNMTRPPGRTARLKPSRYNASLRRPRRSRRDRRCRAPWRSPRPSASRWPAARHRLRAGRLDHQPHVLARHRQLEGRAEVAARHLLAARLDRRCPAGTSRTRASASAGAMPRPFAIANTSATPAAITKSIELPKILYAAADRPARRGTRPRRSSSRARRDRVEHRLRTGRRASCPTPSSPSAAT